MASRDRKRELQRKVRQRTAEVHQREEEVALRLVSASEYRDEDTGSHIRRMGLYASALAEALGWTAEEAQNIRVAAPMHDVGKIGVPDGILLKTGKLTTEEFEVVKKHSEIGATILDESDIPLLNMAYDIALHHHERWAGNGYPHGLSGEAIPLCARIVSVADVYDALVHTRPYRLALPEEQALEIMDADRGKHFDPWIFDRFMEILPEIRSIRAQVASG
jgi:response regulator RpfG family c-di-GMP phosphodiesterase